MLAVTVRTSNFKRKVSLVCPSSADAKTDDVLCAEVPIARQAQARMKRLFGEIGDGQHSIYRWLGLLDEEPFTAARDRYAISGFPGLG